MTLVGSVKQNKPESAALFLDGKQSLFFYHCSSKKQDCHPLHMTAS